MPASGEGGEGPSDRRSGAPRGAVPYRTIAAAIGMVLGTGAAIYLLEKLTKVLTYLVVAAFFALILNPAVDFLQHRLRFRRALATIVVFLIGIALTAAMLYAFIRPLVDQAQKFSDDLPGYVDDAKAGRGPVGSLVKKYKVDEYVQKNQEKLRAALSNAGKPAARLASSVFSTIAALVTILVLTFLMVLEGPKLIAGILRLIPPRQRDRVRRVAHDCNRAITGYMFGNLAISVIAGIATYICLWPLGVPFRGVLSLWVAFADLIPLVGATLGAVVVGGVAFLHGPKAGIATVIFFVIYQQFENHVLQTTIMSRTVDLNPLAVLVSVLVGVELFGLLGALLAIPAGGIIQVISRDVYDENLGMLKEEPTIGADEVPISEIEREEDAAEERAAPDVPRADPALSPAGEA